MKYKSQTLKDLYNELLIFSPSTYPKVMPLTLYHYTSNEAKKNIVNEKTDSINFRLTKASDFLDKNEGSYIFEPYLHACGSLYNTDEIDFDFYNLLKELTASDIAIGIDHIWVLCLTAEGYSKYMKERYAPNDGWLIGLHATAIEDLIFAFSRDTDQLNRIDMAEVRYSYQKMKKEIQELIRHLYDCYQSDNSSSKKEKDGFAKSIIKLYLSTYNLCYKVSSYSAEKETRVICYIKKPFTKWGQSRKAGNISVF